MPSLADARPGGKSATPSAASPTSSPARLRACLLHDYRESRQMSMKLYAEQLGAALEGLGVEVERVRPPEVLPRGLQRGLLDKLDSYAGRFVVYPRLARRCRADVFHIVDHGQGYLVSSLDPARTVVTCHDLILLLVAARRVEKEFSPRVATAVLRRAVQAMGGARRIIADSEQTRRDLAEFVGIDPARVAVVYPGLNYPFRPQPELRDERRARLGLPGGLLVLQVGQVGFYKNLPGCLRVIERLRRGGLDVTFVRGGRRMDAGQQALARRLGLEGAIHEVGPVSADDLAALYGACDVLLFPSLYEGFGWPPLEAMASGLPVVSTRAGSLREVVGEAALTAEPEDVEGLAAHVAAILTDGALAGRLRALGLAHAATFDWRRTAEQVLGIYRSVVEA